jgi:hypothetical protein
MGGALKEPGLSGVARHSLEVAPIVRGLRELPSSLLITLQDEMPVESAVSLNLAERLFPKLLNSPARNLAGAFPQDAPGKPMVKRERLSSRQRLSASNPFEKERSALLNLLVHRVAHGVNNLVRIREASRDDAPKRLRGIHSGETATMDKARG